VRAWGGGRDSKKETAEQRKFLMVADKPTTAVWIDRTATRTRANDRATESIRVHSLLHGRENRTYSTAECSSVASFRHPLVWHMSVFGPDSAHHDTEWHLALYSARAVHLLLSEKKIIARRYTFSYFPKELQTQFSKETGSWHHGSSSANVFLMRLQISGKQPHFTRGLSGK